MTQGSSSDWKKIWTRYGGTNATNNVTVFEAHSSSNSVQNIRGFGAITNRYDKPDNPYFLKYTSVWLEVYN